ncbi:hypothetical protein CgunFtcFv8_023392 [Champsocephalus gunnari]|uniref:Uncharacterized protein n=1 Tax=Champsocephalus gunnari TaxID=52237 RepID=A0AAN8DC95_CHAGU|nr:hypothetical protein CgunFtcFv8_023392 [Champsocephalus gunnari]
MPLRISSSDAIICLYSLVCHTTPSSTPRAATPYSRLFCSYQPAAPATASPDSCCATTSQEPLMESSTPDSLRDPAPDVQLPSYEQCKRLPTYEETVREGNTGRSEFNMEQVMTRTSVP